MKLSELKIKTLRDTGEASINADLLIRAGYINQLSAGIYTFLPLGKMVLDNISNIIREEMNLLGGQEVLMPALQPARNWQQTGRWEDMDDLFRFQSYYTKTDYALGATHEEVVAPLMGSIINSYRDLPVYVYQIQTKFRDEKRSKSGLLRNREFLMKDLYSFHPDEKDLDSYYEKVKKSYQKIFDRVGIGAETYLTYASGGSFSKYSHEFQTVCDAGEDVIYICKKCRIAINKEIINDLSACPDCGAKDLVQEKSIEVGNIFKLGTKYSEPFDLSYRDKHDKKHFVVMGCYGIGPGRVMGTIVEKNSDKKGLLWPESVAPFDIHLVTLDEKKTESADLYKNLKESGISVLWDDRDIPTGVKLADSDLLGVPLRVIVSKRTLAEDSCEIKERSSEEGELIKLEGAVEKIKNVK